MEYLIVGNGAAGIAAAERIRKLDKKGEITILSAEKYAVYSKCLLPDFLSGHVSEDGMFIRDGDFYKEKGINICYNHKVLNINFNLKQVTTDNVNNYSESGTIFKYDKLLIATGSTAIVPEIDGLARTNAYYLNTLDDAKRIIMDSRDSRRILIIGAGFVGLETAFNLYKKGREVTIVERASGILPGQLDETASRIIQNSVEEEGIRLILNSTISEVTSSIYSNIINAYKGINTRTVVINNGQRLKSDMIIVATGSKPNLDFIKHSTITVNKGILVDKYMQSSITDVYAAGDVVESIDAVTGKNSLSPIWPNAVIQGEFAGSNMAGCKQEFNSLVSMQNASEFREIPMISMGITAPDGSEYEEYVDYRPVDMVYRKLVILDNTVVGMIFLGDIRNAGVIGALMKQKIDVGKFKNNMLNSNFGYSEVGTFS